VRSLIKVRRSIEIERFSLRRREDQGTREEELRARREVELER
jgi:hypothetical protein